MKHINKILILILLTIFISCGGAGEVHEKNIDNTKVFNTSKDAIWSAVISTFGDMNFPIKTLEKSSWLLQSEKVNISNSDIYRYTTTEEGQYNGGEMSFTIYLKDGKDKNSTIATISSNFSGLWQETTLVSGRVRNQGWQQMYSNGNYEKIIFQKITGTLIKK